MSIFVESAPTNDFEGILLLENELTDWSWVAKGLKIFCPEALNTIL